MAAEIERTKWKQFRFYLDKKDRKMFDKMYELSYIMRPAFEILLIIPAGSSYK